MDSFRQAIRDKLKSNRAKLSDSSAITYSSLLFNLNKKMDGDNKVSWFTDDVTQIMAHIKDMDVLHSKKTILSALYILTELSQYKELMLAICKTVNDEYAEQKLSPKQEANRITFAKVTETHDSLLEKLNKVPSLENYIKYLLVALMSGVTEGIKPRRNEWSTVKIKNYDPKTDNYYKAGKFYFVNYKTSKIYLDQVVKVPKNLLKIIHKWLKINNTDFFFFQHKSGKPLTSSMISKTLKTVFGKAIGCDALRSIYLSEIYKDMPAVKEMMKTAQEMGHSLQTLLTNYVKK